MKSLAEFRGLILVSDSSICHAFLPQAKLVASTTKMPSHVAHLKTHEAHRGAEQGSDASFSAPRSSALSAIYIL